MINGRPYESTDSDVFKPEEGIEDSIVDLRSYSTKDDTEFYANLADDILPETTLTRIAESLLESIDEDLDARDNWETAIKKGLDYLGLKVNTMTFPFDGASGVYSSVFLQSALTFTANARAELLPMAGPCKIDILGDATQELQDQSKRVQTYVNYYLTQVDREFYSEMEKTFLWGCLVGSVFVKVYKHPILNRPTVDRIMPQDFIVSQNTKSLETSSRICQCLYLNTKQLRERQISGYYRNDIELQPYDSLESDQSDIQTKVEKIEGISHESLEYDDQYVLYECHVDLDIAGLEHTDEEGNETGIPLPYIVTIDKNSRDILSIYRNWDEKDPHYKRINYFVDFTYVPGLDFLGLGLVHIAGGCAQAATSLTRQSIDASTLSNFPGGMRVKGMRLQDNNIRIGPTEFVEIETGGLPIRDAIMTMPYKEPNAITLQMKQDMEDQIRALAAITNIKLDDISSNMPVGTIYALIEQTAKPQSAIMARYHSSFGRLLKILFRLFSECLPEEPYFFKVPGQRNAIMRKDFQDDIDIIPVSDPELSSATQRLVRAEAISKIAGQDKNIHNMRAINEIIYSSMGMDQDTIDKIMPPPQETKPQDPITENANMIRGGAAVAGMDQDHTAHIQTHSALLTDQSLQQMPQVLSSVQAHIQQHLSMKYVMDMQQRMGMQLPGADQQIPPQIQNQIAQKAAEASKHIQQEALQALQAATQKENQPDPTQLIVAEMQQRAEYEQKKLELEMMKLKLKEKDDLRKAQLKESELLQKSESEELSRQTELLKEEMKRTPL